MTRHQRPEERRREILDAAAAEIDERGLPALTMDAVIARTSLSKGGVYRFFRNKADLTAALLDDILGRWSQVDVEAALSSGLPAEETLLRLILPHDPSPDSLESRDRRVWLQLLPESLRDPEMAKIRTRHQREALSAYGELARGLIARAAPSGKPGSEGAAGPPQESPAAGRASEDSNEWLEGQLALGLIFGSGLMVLAATGEAPRTLEDALRRFLRRLISEARWKVAA